MPSCSGGAVTASSIDPHHALGTRLTFVVTAIADEPCGLDKLCNPLVASHALMRRVQGRGSLSRNERLLGQLTRYRSSQRHACKQQDRQERLDKAEEETSRGHG